MPEPDFAAVILAAGSGTRMRSAIPKVMHPLAGRPMIFCVLEALRPLAPAVSLAVIGRGMQAVARALAPLECVVQEPPLGTGDAVRRAAGALAPHLAPAGGIEDVLVLYGDTPLIEPNSLRGLIAERRRAPAAAVVVAAMRPEDPGPYGRLVLGQDGSLERVVEAPDAGPQEAAIGLVNGGIMAIAARPLLALLEALDRGNAKGEFYLTDIVGIARREGLLCRALELPAQELIGVNTRAELAQAEALMQARLRRNAMDAGATLIAPETVFLSADTLLERDCVVEPHVVFGPGVRVGEGAQIRSFCHLEGAVIGKGAKVGPFARMRGGTLLEEKVEIGNFVELKAARIGKGAKAKHLSYLGDSEVGERANIGAGTITCNYDGFEKHRTVIGEGAFIGSNAALVAPIVVGAGAYVAAGSTLTEDVPPDALALARGRQVEKPGRAAAIRARRGEKG
jgi:bifunctional UDP-N-acetylglucosamine pyrophosphorylase/glucosamine-1-phosphate N-acetyltransferase